MDYAVICVVAFGTSLLTFFTGFGLGTLLLPAFAAFFPAQVAVALTAVVHLLNNLFKLFLVGRHADLRVALRFGGPAIPASLAGALVLVWLSGLDPLWTYRLFGRTVQVMPVAFAVAVLMVAFAVLELWPRFRRMAVPRAYLPLGGVVAGFFGGISGHQGALRSAFLVRSGLSKEAFIATGVIIASVIDISRLIVYTDRFFTADLERNSPLLGAATLAAFTGAILGSRLLRKISLRVIEVGVAVLLILVAVGMGAGLI